MGMTPLAHFSVYGQADEAESIATLHRALELGVTMLDTAELYGPLLNERLISKAIASKREKYTLATKFGIEVDDQEQLTWKANGKPDYVRKAAERSLKNLKTDYIDLYYLHRPDPNTPIEDTIGAMGELVQQGKVRYIGVSEFSAEQLRLAHSVFPISALQTEYSLFDRRVEEQNILATARELGIGFVAYSPLGRGFLSGDFKTPEDFPAGDFRIGLPRYSGDNFYKNLELVDKVKAFADAKGVSSTQLAIAWVLAQNVVPIPGTKRVKYLEENVAASAITFTPAELEELDAIVPVGATLGAAY